MSILNVIAPISGFTQSRDKKNGFDCLWEDLRPLVKPETTLITPMRWCDNMAYWANWLSRHLKQNDHTILVAAYSWGGGWGFPQLAKECNKRGLKIRAAVLCDPVYRSRWHVMKWRSVINRGPLKPRIKVPPNVGDVFWYYQRQNKPQAHQLVKTKGSDTVIHPGKELKGFNHAYMDDAEVFHKHVVDLCTEILN